MKNDFETNTYVNIIFLSVFDLLECQPGKNRDRESWKL